MDLTTLTALVTALIGLSIAAQRLVEIVKNLIPPLNTESTDPNKENWRKAGLQLLAVLAGIATAYLAQGSKLLAGDLPIQNPLLLGLLAGGGSDFWTSILGYVKGIKEIKTTQALDTKVKVAANIADTAARASTATVGIMAVGAHKDAQDSLNDILTIAGNKLKRSL